MKRLLGEPGRHLRARGVSRWLRLAFSLAACLLVLALPGVAHAQPSIIYVDKDAAAGGDGSSWPTAYKTVQEALDETNANGAALYEVWVAEGTYYPDEGNSHVNDSRDESFRVSYDNVQLYGGFAATETLRTERDWLAHATVLSGDSDAVAGPDGNAYHVVFLDGVTNEDITAATVLDGFTISGGNANGSSPQNSGGGIYCNGNGPGHACSPLLANLLISGNSASQSGGGLFNGGKESGESSPLLTNVTVSANSADHGGGLYNAGWQGQSSPVLTNVTVSGNIADEGGGGMYNEGVSGQSSPLLTNVLISGNSGGEGGGGLFNDGKSGQSSPVLTNVTISGNRAGSGGGMRNSGASGQSSPQLTNSIVWGNTGSPQIYNDTATPGVTFSNVQGGGYTGNNIDLDPLFVTPLDASSAPTTTGDYRLLRGSPSIDTGTNSGCPVDDLDGRARPIDGDGDSNAVCDMGAYETPQMPFLRVAKQVTPAAIMPGGAVTYTLVLSNVGTLQEPAALLTDTLPASVAFGGWVQNSGATEAGGQITWGGGLAPQAAVTLTFTATHTGGYNDVVANTVNAGGSMQVISATAAFSATSLIFVDGTIAASGDGRSWATAYKTVQEALDETNANGGTDYEVWVAEGTYYPDEGNSHVNDSRDESFRVNWDNVQLYGGFAATETLRTERDWIAHPTVLSGDIDQNGALANNAQHVLYLDGATNEGITAATVLDGFTISGGNADAVVSPYDGGGIYCDGGGSGRQCSPQLVNLHIRDNYAALNGGGLYNNGVNGGESSPTLTDVTISGNSAGFYGGGMYNNGVYGESSPTLTDVTISGNTATFDGAGMVNGGHFGASRSVLVRVTISGNSAGDRGGGLYNDGRSGVSSPVLTDVLLSGNSAGKQGGGMFTNGDDGGVSNPRLIAVTISGNRAGNRGGGLFIYGAAGTSTPQLLNSILWGNTAVEGAQFYTAGGSLAVTYSNVQGALFGGAGNISDDPLFAAPITGTLAPTTTGDYRLLPGSLSIDAGTDTGAPDTDIRGLPRPVNGMEDMGAYEAQGFTLAVTGGDNQTAAVGAAFGQRLAVQISSAASEPVGPGGVITFTPPSSGAGITLTQPFTVAADASGAGSTSVTANGLTGSYSVTAAVRGVAAAQVFTLTNTPISVTVALTGTGGGAVSSSPAGIDCGVTCTVAFDYSAPVTLTATAAAGSTFGGWSGACSGTGVCTLTITQSRAVTAAFSLNQYTVAVSASPSAGGAVSGGGAVNYGQAVTVTASANTGYTFLNWTEGVTEVSTSASYTFTAAGNRTLVAHFSLNQYSISVSAEPAAGGTVSGDGTVRHGDTVTVTATSNSGYTFLNWTEGGTAVSTSASYTFTATGDRTLVANFGLNQYAVAVSANPSAGGAVSGGGAVNYGQAVTVTASANTGYTFLNWTEGVTEVSTSASYTFTAAANRTLVANFTLNQYTVAVSASPAAGGTVSGGGTVNYGQAVTLTATANTGYTFLNWTEGGGQVSTDAGYSFTAAGNRTLVAHFSLNQYTVAATADPSAGGVVSGGGTVRHGDMVTVTATANTGYTFVNWTEGATPVSTSGTYTFTATGSRTLVANFTLNQYAVAVSADPVGGGTVSGDGTVSHGDTVTVTATANSGYTFVNWTEGATPVSTSGTYTFTATGSRTLVANFTLNQYTVGVSASPAAGGRVSGGGTANYGQAVTVTATANTGYTFLNWTEGATPVSTSGTYTFTAAANRTLVANFSLNQYTVGVSADPAAGGSVGGGGAVRHGDTVTVTATANTGYTFVNWTEGGGQVSTDAGYSFTATNSRTLVAHFTVLPQPLALNDAAGVLGGGVVDIAVLANDLDPSGRGLTLVEITQPAHGRASIEAGGASVRYAAAAGFSGATSFTYTMQDANSLRSTALVALVVAPLAHAGEAPQLTLLNPAIQQSTHFTSSQAHVQVQLPAGFYTGTVGATDILYLAYTPVITPTAHTLTPPGVLQFGNFQFELTLYLNDLPQHRVPFAQPITLTIVYNGALLLGLDAATLQLNSWDGAGWSTAGITILSHDSANGILVVALSHLSEFAFFAAPAPSDLDPAPEPDGALIHLYLPAVSR